MRVREDAFKERYKLFFIGYFALIIGITFFRFPESFILILEMCTQSIVK